MFSSFLKSLFIECTERTTRAGHRVTSLSYCTVMGPAEILENCFFLVFGVLLSAVLYQICVFAVSLILSACEWCHLIPQKDSLLRNQEKVPMVFNKFFPSDVTQLFPRMA